MFLVSRPSSILLLNCCVQMLTTAAAIDLAGGSRIQFGAYDFTQNAGGNTATFDAAGRLLSVGETDFLKNPIPGAPGLGLRGGQTAGSNLVDTGVLGWNVANPNSTFAHNGVGPNGVNDPGFGGGAAAVWAFPFLISGGFNLFDPLGNDLVGSTLDIQANGAWTNNLGFAVSGIAGAWLAYHGTFGAQANAVVAASVVGEINGVAFTPIVLAGSSIAGQPVSLSGDFANLIYYNCGPNFCNDFIAGAISVWGPVIIPHGGVFTVDMTLSVIADPPASMEIVPLDIPLLFPNQDVTKPDFGVSYEIPEPDTFALIGLGLTVAALYGKKARS